MKKKQTFTDLWSSDDFADAPCILNCKAVGRFHCFLSEVSNKILFSVGIFGCLQHFVIFLNLVLFICSLKWVNQLLLWPLIPVINQKKNQAIRRLKFELVIFR